MTYRRHFSAVLLAASLLAIPALADDSMIMVEQPWARATPGATKTGAVYLTIMEHGDADRLIGASTPVADMAMLHEGFVEGGISKMRMLDSIALAPHTQVTLHPGAMHIMLEGLKAPLKPGETFPLTLTFEKAPPQTVNVTVMKPGANGPADMGGMKMGN
jgi:copper(I)-binding protein